MRCRAEPYVEQVWNRWVDEARAPALGPTLQLYNELLAANWGIVFITGRTESQRNATTQNLISAGYVGWKSLILRYISCALHTFHLYADMFRPDHCNGLHSHI